MISIYVQSEFQLEIQVNETIESVKNILITQINSLINYIRIINQENFFVSALGTNVIYYIGGDGVYLPYEIFGTQTMTLESLNMYLEGKEVVMRCAHHSVSTAAYLVSVENSSSSSDHIYWSENQPNFLSINGFFVGCTAFEALLQSTLDCLYDINCLQFLIENFPNLNQV